MRYPGREAVFFWTLFHIKFFHIGMEKLDMKLRNRWVMIGNRDGILYVKMAPEKTTHKEKIEEDLIMEENQL